MTLLAHGCALLLLAGACRHVPSERERSGARIHYDLGISQQQEGEVQKAYLEFQQALKLDPDFAEAHNAIALLLHVVFKRPDEAIVHYHRAIELRAEFSEAKTNLGNVFLAQGRYDEAITQYREALNDMLYGTPFIAQGNLGWALFKKGEVEEAIQNIKAAVTTNPKFCLGYKNLGLIHDEQGETERACEQFTRFRESCPEVGDAYYREGVCRARLGDVESARMAFAACQTKASAPELKDDCRRLLSQLQ